MTPDPVRVVLVDDTADLRLLLRTALEARGRLRVVGEAGDGATGVDVVSRTRPDLVLVDLAMPVLDGLEAIPALRRACPPARLVVLSAFQSAHVTARALAAGADGYLHKGLDPWALEERLVDIARGSAEGPPRPPGPRLPAPAEHRAPAGLLDQAPFGVLTLSVRPPAVLSANPAARRLLAGPDGDLVLPGPLAEAAAAHAAGLLAGEPPVELEVDGAAVPLRVTLTAALPGVAAYLVPAAADGTAWLRGAVAGAVHEIRNPTVVIAGAVAALLGDGPAGKPLPAGLREDLLRAVARQTRLLDRATADLLTAAQAHHDAVRVDPRPLVLADVLASTVADVGGAEAVELDCPPRLTVLADPLRVQQMVLNLLGNAAKYGAPPVTVRARADGDGVRVSVTDAGPGVPAHLVATLFDEFTRVPGTGAPGSGLGLFVVRSLARVQGGRAWYETGEGGGASFVFTLPAAPAPQSGEVAAAAPSTEAAR